MALHQSEVITYIQVDANLRLRVRALIAKQNVTAGRNPNPEVDLDRILWEIAVDAQVLTFMGTQPDAASVSAKAYTATDAQLLNVINRVLAP